MYHNTQINCTSAVCALNEVKWSSEMNLEKHDSFFYQCVVAVKEGSAESVKTVGTFYSNVLALDVQRRLSFNFLSPLPFSLILLYQFMRKFPISHNRYYIKMSHLVCNFTLMARSFT
jgi:hypothetical protein